MRPAAFIIDEFLPDYSAARTYFDTAEFQESTLNPQDGLRYPTTIDMTEDQFGVERQLGMIFGCRIGLQAIIARLALKDVVSPYAVHSDAFMGCEYTCLIYLTRQADIERGAGTTLCRRMDTRQETYMGLPQDLEYAQVDGKWGTVLHCEMQENRAFIFPSNRLHYSSPFWGGLGTDQQNGRLVLAVLFSLAGLTT